MTTFRETKAWWQSYKNTQYAKSWHRSKPNKVRYILKCFRPNIHVKTFFWIRKINYNWSWKKCRGMSMWDIYETAYRKDLWCVQVSDGVRTLESNAHVQQRSDCKLLVGKLLLKERGGWGRVKNIKADLTKVEFKADSHREMDHDQSESWILVSMVLHLRVRQSDIYCKKITSADCP